MRVGIIGTGAIANMHAQAYRNIGYQVTACTDVYVPSGEKYAARWGCEFVPDYEDLCSRADVDYIDVCTFPNFRLEPVEAAVKYGKHVQLQKPIATNLATARKIVETARAGGIVLGVASQHRFDDSTKFVKKAIAEGRMGKILQADAYVKWWRTEEYYSRPIKGSWEVEGGGALINQAVHQVDILRYLIGGVDELFGYWQLAARHKIESEDVVNAILKYNCGATGVIQASTAFWPGYSERIEIHGTKGTAIFTGYALTSWDVMDDCGRSGSGRSEHAERILRPDGDTVDAVRTPVPRLRRGLPRTPRAADLRRRGFEGAGDRARRLRVLPQRQAGQDECLSAQWVGPPGLRATPWSASWTSFGAALATPPEAGPEGDPRGPGEGVRPTDGAQSAWKTSSISAHHSPGLRVGRGSCMGSMMAHHSCVFGSAAIFAMSAAKSLPMYSK